jgi:hypothetical protein
VDGPFYVRRKDSPPKLFWLRSAKLIRVGSTVFAHLRNRLIGQHIVQAPVRPSLSIFSGPLLTLTREPELPKRYRTRVQQRPHLSHSSNSNDPRKNKFRRVSSPIT